MKHVEGTFNKMAESNLRHISATNGLTKLGTIRANLAPTNSHDNKVDCRHWDVEIEHKG